MRWTATDKLLLSAVVPSAASQARVAALTSGRDNEIDWAQAADCAANSYLAPLLRFNLMRAGVIERVPPDVRRKLEAESHGWAARHLAYVHCARELIRALGARGVTTLPLKGAALMLGGYYPLAGLRVAADVDLLIDRADGDRAEEIAAAMGFHDLPDYQKKTARAAAPLAHELRHLPTRQNAGGVLLELHYRAFHTPRTGRDFGLAEMWPRAERRAVAGREILFPAAEDICLHLIQHTVVELWNANAVFRTLADLYFVFETEPQARTRLIARAAEFDLLRATELTLKALDLLSHSRLDELAAPRGTTVKDRQTRDAACLLDVALAASSENVMEAARILEYFDFRQPTALSNLRSLLFGGGAGMNGGAGRNSSRANLKKLLRLPQQSFHLLRRFHWAGLAPRHLRRVLRIRRLTHGRSR